MSLSAADEPKGSEEFARTQSRDEQRDQLLKRLGLSEETAMNEYRQALVRFNRLTVRQDKQAARAGG